MKKDGVEKGVGENVESKKNDDVVRGRWLLIPENRLRQRFIIKCIIYWLQYAYMDFSMDVCTNRLKAKAKNILSVKRSAEAANVKLQPILSMGGFNPDENMIKLCDFVEGIGKENCIPALMQDLQVLESLMVMEIRPPSYQLSTSSLFNQKSSNPCHSDWTPEVTAQQLTMMTKKLWDNLSLWEFYNVAFTKADKDTVCPKINSLISQINRVSDWAKTIILTLDDPKKRGACMSFLIQTLDWCLKNKDYSDGMALSLALQATSLERLKRSWKLVPDEDKATLENVKKLFDPRRNYNVFRKKIEENPHDPQILFIGILMGDIIHADEVPKQIESRHNWHKYDLLGRILSVIPKYQRMKINFEIDQRFVNYFEKIQLLDEQQIRAKSRELEPEKIEK